VIYNFEIRCLHAEIKVILEQGQFSQAGAETNCQREELREREDSQFGTPGKSGPAIIAFLYPNEADGCILLMLGGQNGNPG
jgi:hypothetical protein